MNQLAELKELVDQFKNNHKDYISWNFNETNTRQQFIDKFFELLWWDINNKFWYSEQYKEVVLEDKLKINWQSKAPDYSFRIGGRRIFFVEAKKPSVNIKDDILPAYQIRRYSWTAKLPIGILTDFEELAIYDTRVKPDQKDKVGVARIAYFTYDQFEENRDWIYNTLSKEAVQKWALDRYMQESKKSGTQSVDVDFLSMIDDWRNSLAKNIYLRYGNERSWDLDRLNAIVGDIVDKIIFLRIAEDKKIENLWNLQNIANWKEIWNNLIAYFEKSDKKYNSWLFNNTEIFKKFELDDKILKKILLSLYYPECPYEFSVLGVDILGNIYEKFLGKILVKDGRTIKTEFKPDVKKAGWVFYTPQYIVDYIVKNTVWELLKNKTPKQALDLHIVDPACGSGAFLIGAYDYILNRFLEQHTKDDKLIKTAIKESKIYEYKESYHLSFNYKKEILRSMIYWVDIDRQAVAVSKLSLLLKLLEWETAETANQLFSTIDAALLPKLDDNIKCGNSLVDSSIYGSLWVVDEATIKKINAFDWEKEFAEIFKEGGFDAVIGNPPYIKEYTNREIFDYIKKSSLAKYYQGKMDFWYLFACKGLDSLKKWGLLWFIAPNNWVTNAWASKMRQKITQESKIKIFLDFVNFMVFQNASIQTMVYVLEKKIPEKEYALEYTKVLDWKITETELSSFLSSNKIENIKNSIGIQKVLLSKNDYQNWEPVSFVGWSKVEIIKKITEKWSFKLTAKEVANWIHPHYDFVNNAINQKHGNRFSKWEWIFWLSNQEKQDLQLNENETFLVKPYFSTEQFWRYYASNKNKLWLIYTDSSFKNPKSMDAYPNLKRHLDKFKTVITSSNKPYGLHRARDEKFFLWEKIIVARKCQEPWFSYVNFDSYVSATFYVIKTERFDMRYLTWLLNSSLVKFWLKNKWKMQWMNFQIDKGPLLQIPIAYNEAEKNNLINLVDQMLIAQKKLKEVEFDDDKKTIEKQIEIIDKKIDDIVFDLYGLTEEEKNTIING